VFGPSGYTQFYLNGRNLYGPSGHTSCYVSGDHVHGPEESLPWHAREDD
jgi:hypothetical protein